MKSVIIIGPSHPLRGGLASYDERLTREFNQKNWSSTIYTFSLQYPSFLFPGKSQYSDEPAPSDLRIKVCVNSINPFNWIKIGKELKDLKPDLIIVRFWLPFMGPCLGTILRLVKKNKHTQIVCIADNILPHEKRFGDLIFTKYFLSTPHSFITMSENVLEKLKMFLPNSIAKVAQHPLYDNFGMKVEQSLARQKLGIGEDEKICLFFGFIRKYKGLDLLLEAFSHPDIYNSNIKLLVAGEFYEDEKPYLNLIKDKKLEPKLYWHTHFISDSDVKYYLSAADVVIQPYKDATQSGVTPLAYHFEIPMIVTNVGALPSLVPDHKVGLVCEPDSQSISLSILEYFQLNKDIFTKYIKEEKKKLSWSTLVDSIVSLCHDLEK
ncbi:MAG: glycosyltransferase [Saprospiraceae bacterium]